MSEKPRRKAKVQPISRSKDISLIPRLFDLSTGQVLPKQPEPVLEEVKKPVQKRKSKEAKAKLRIDELKPLQEVAFELPLLSERGTSATMAELFTIIEAPELTPSPQKPVARALTPEKSLTSSSSSASLASTAPSKPDKEDKAPRPKKSIAKSQSSKSIGKSLMFQLQQKSGSQSSNLASNQRKLKIIGLNGSISALLQGPSECDGFGYLYAYCVKDNLNELKIGRSKNFPDRRISHSEATNKKKYMIIETFGCNYHMLLEKSVHCELAEYRVELPEHWDGRTEWFRVSWTVARPAISNVLAGITLIYPPAAN
mmetsp:Transcript_3422/g.7126  ORF Transcript_3422/g.7126 Transcript_3422/m.7126 type:complete len:313 (-) Transcript_3422:110-1048(-)|eukprot:CAMPEP_0204906946 /NCGR_PEP_ID=MMETSP1397-20131031/6236_1 /ASSEMBLY_ACC=CAM_ASM_000891 /TAXON_ID=49980 /ORGANISM="Climacostomum Climacostomum virens, Strain Stock W-24" /LENGTH=312 /DNA_ID=CAMNT_0052075953 /DNA_START=843 /DNA_END=1781 /DNA_ORIENTATION=+